VGRDQQLSTRRRLATLLRQLRQQARVQKVLWLFDANKRGRRGVVQQHQVRQHLQRAVGREPRKHGVGKRRILNLEQQPAIGHRLCKHLLDTGHTPPQHAENLL
jgi:hypothetical protein